MSKNTGTRHIYTVSEIIQNIKGLLQNAFGDNVWIEGEVSNINYHSSGHLYFSLKDSTSVLAAAMFAWANKGIKFKIEDGLKVICFGRIDCYVPRSQYQIIVERIEPKGIGSLQLALEQLKVKLEKEGLFKTERKRPIPYLPSRIGVVTSLSGAAIRDILKVLDRRFRNRHIIIRPAQVQGDTAGEDIAQAISDLNAFNESLPSHKRIEVMIVGRGGGSIEDLWAFNEEIVARAIYHSKIPVISAVGHERDWTIADLVADVRAATPSVAAELVIPKKEELREQVRGLSEDVSMELETMLSHLQDSLDDCFYRLNLSMQNVLKLNRAALESARNKLGLLSPQVAIQQAIQKVADLTKQFRILLGHLLELRQADFNKAAGKLASLSPLNILARGYSITFKMPQGGVVKDASLLKAGDMIKSRVYRGEVLSQITEVK
ncbi:MAG: exodeoxyribonuclease VII large subunit [Candidatus Omnitrophota bacterium]